MLTYNFWIYSSRVNIFGCGFIRYNCNCFLNLSNLFRLHFFREQEATRLKKAKRRKWKRYALIGLATAGGGALVGLTGGLAAPLVAAGAGSY